MFKLPKLSCTIPFPKIVQMLYRKPAARVFQQSNQLVYILRTLEKGDKLPPIEFLPGYLIQQISKETFSWLTDQNIVLPTNEKFPVPLGYELEGTFYSLNKEYDDRLITYFVKKPHIGMVERMGKLNELEHYTYDHNRGQ